MTAVVKLNPSQLLCRTFDLKAGEDLTNDAQIYLDGVKYRILQGLLDSGREQSGMLSVQMPYEHVVSYLCMVH